MLSLPAPFAWCCFPPHPLLWVAQPFSFFLNEMKFNLIKLNHFKKLSSVGFIEVKFSSVEWWSLLLPLGGAAFPPPSSPTGVLFPGGKRTAPDQMEEDGMHHYPR